jgi:hypothetical protein
LLKTGNEQCSKLKTENRSFLLGTEFTAEVLAKVSGSLWKCLQKLVEISGLAIRELAKVKYKRLEVSKLGKRSRYTHLLLYCGELFIINEFLCKFEAKFENILSGASGSHVKLF